MLTNDHPFKGHELQQRRKPTYKIREVHPGPAAVREGVEINRRLHTDDKSRRPLDLLQ